MTLSREQKQQAEDMQVELTIEQQTIITNEINKNWRTGCSKCAGTDFTIFDHLYQLQPVIQGNVNLGGSMPVVPSVLVMCENCGDMSLISSIFLGITKSS